MNNKNLANAQLLNSITSTDTVFEVKQGQGVDLPTAPFYATITPLGVLSTRDNSEIVQVTAVNVDELTVVRGQLDTTAKYFAADSVIANSIYVEDVNSKAASTDLIEALPETVGTAGKALVSDGTDIVWGDTGNADTLDGHTASETPTAGQIPIVNTGGGLYIEGDIYSNGKNLVDMFYPVGSTYFNKTNPTNPATLLGFGTWVALQGVVLGGRSETSGSPFNVAAGTIIGEDEHQLTEGEMPKHNHSGSTNSTGNHRHSVGGSDFGFSLYKSGGAGRNQVGTGTSRRAISSDNINDLAFATVTNYDGTHSHSFTTNITGGDVPHNNIQRTLVGYLWERTA